jgi:hypothetical protein
MLILNTICTNPDCQNPADYIFQVFTTEKTRNHALMHGFPVKRALNFPIGYAGDVYICFKHASWVMESPRFLKNFDLTLNIRLFRDFWSLLDHYSTHD